MVLVVLVVETAHYDLPSHDVPLLRQNELAVKYTSIKNDAGEEQLQIRWGAHVITLNGKCCASLSQTEALKLGAKLIRWAVNTPEERIAEWSKSDEENELR